MLIPGRFQNEEHMDSNRRSQVDPEILLLHLSWIQQVVDPNGETATQVTDNCESVNACQEVMTDDQNCKLSKSPQIHGRFESEPDKLIMFRRD